MKFHLGIALLALVASATAASADTGAVTYTFSGYCDGFALTETLDGKTNTAAGTHLYKNCSESDQAVGGLFGNVTGIGKNLWAIAGYDTNAGLPLVFYLDQNAMTWTLYGLVDGSWLGFNSGSLVNGYGPPSGGRANGSPSTMSNMRKLAQKGSVPPPDKTVDFTFADKDGNLYCDGLTLSDTTAAEEGTHTGCTNSDAAGGGRGIIPVILGRTGRTVYTTDSRNISATTLEAFVIDQKHRTWILYEVAADGSTTWQQVTSGVLRKGVPTPGISGKPSGLLKK